MSSGSYSIVSGINTPTPPTAPTTAPTTAPITAPITAPTTAPIIAATIQPNFYDNNMYKSSQPQVKTYEEPSKPFFGIGEGGNYLTNNINNATSSLGLLGGILIFLIVFIWMISGVLGFIMAIICLFYNSPMEEKIIGLLASIILGPFFWLYYIYSNTYCMKY